MKRNLYKRILSILLVVSMSVPVAGINSYAASTSLKQAPTASVSGDLVEAEDAFDDKDADVHGGVKLYEVDEVIEPGTQEYYEITGEDTEGTSVEEILSDIQSNDSKALSVPSSAAGLNRDWYKYGSKYFYEKLNYGQKELYRDLYSYSLYLIGTIDDNSEMDANVKHSVVRSGGQNIKEYLSPGFRINNYGLTTSQASDAYDIFLYENPQFYFWDYMTYSNSSSYPNDPTMWFSIYTIFADSKARAQYTQQIFSKLDSLVNIVNGESSDAAKIRKAMVLVMNMNIYAFSKDSRAASGAVKPVYNEQYDQSLYSSIMLGYSVCAGYAKAMQAILSSCGIHIVTATSYNTKASTGHAWNYVYMNGAWYQVDATWEDNDSMHYNAQDGSYQPDVWVRDNTIDNFTDHFYLISDSRMDYYDSQQSVSGMHQAIYYYTNLINFPVCNANYPSRSGYITADFTDYRSDFTRKYSVTPIVANAANAKFKLAKTNLEYNGMEQRPAVRVVVNGRVLSSYYFTAAYPASSKAIGAYKVKIKLRNGYSGSKTLSYNITSKKTKLSSVKAGHGSIKVKWKKVKKQNTGYQIIISTNKNFKKGNKKVLVKGSKKSSKTVNGLKSGRKYFVKVRTYKTVGGKKIFSDWSNKKTVRVR
ncbi:MAG: transglutaminase domain-containing protein [Eubacterium sp.]|nr:transglutaminase domain-containing protein [Eubacterium sp.]